MENYDKITVVNAEDCKELPLPLYDSPYVMDIVIRGGLKHIKLFENNNKTSLWVETFGNNTEETLIIEVHPTGGLLPDADKVTYLGTAMVDGGVYVWHIFYLVRSNGDISDEKADGKPLYEELYTIFKYDFAENGSSTKVIDSLGTVKIE